MQNVAKRRGVFGWVLLIVTSLILISLIPSKLASIETTYKTSWLGNTFSGGSKWVQIQISAIHVTDDGTVYTNSLWDEAGREAGIYKDKDTVGMLSDLHGWGRNGGEAVTANGKYVYVAMIQGNEGGSLTGPAYPPKGTNWYCVRRYNLRGNPAPFSEGIGDGSVLIVSTSSPVSGLASAGDELYVSDPAANRIRVYNTETMTELRNWPSARPQQIVVDHQGNLWAIQAGDTHNTPKILRYAKTGAVLKEQITNVGAPTALAVDRQGRLLVTDNGPRQQVLMYNITGKPRLVNTLGTEGGIYSGKRGEVGDQKLYGLSGVGTDSTGNIYVSNNGFNRTGTDLRKFTPSGTLEWQLLGLQFLDNADADPGTDGADVFTKNEHFVMNYRKGSGQEWSYKGYTLDKFRYPEDGRLHTTPTSAFVRRLEGKRFLYLSSEMMAERLLIYRFDGEVAVPSAIFAKNHQDWPASQPASGSWLWQDLNGDGRIQNNEYESLGDSDDSIWGWEVDSNGDVWQASEAGYIQRFRYQGLDTHGSPTYTGAALEKIPMPAPFSQLERLKYFPDTDIMYLSGYTVDRPNTGDNWGIVGTETVRYDNWSTTRTVRWRVAIPYDPGADPMLIVKAMDIAGDRLFAVTSRTAEVYVYNATTGAPVTKLAPGPEVKHESGWVDIPYGVRAYQRANGEYIVFVEEDSKGKVILYRLGPQASK